MPQSDQSAWNYHLQHLKADGLVIAGAVSGLGLIAWGAATLHGISSPLAMVAQSSVLGAVALAAITMCSRELLRRRGLDKGQPLAGRFPKSAFAAAFLGSLFLTAALTRTHLESGVAMFEGRQHLEAGEYLAAAECFERVIELAPKQAKGYCLRGIARFRAGETLAAYDDLQLALKLQPNNPVAQTALMAAVEQMDTADNGLAPSTGPDE